MPSLLLEQILKRLAGIVGAWRGKCGGLGGLTVGSGRGVLFDGHPEFVECALIPRIFRRDAFRNWLGALKLRAGIEEPALLAAM